jgi:magnesium transporter
MQRVSRQKSSILLDDARPAVLVKINALRRELSYFRKSIRPARETIMKLSKLDNDLIRPATAPFLKDLNDITIQATDAIDTYREMLSDELDIYNSTVSNKMNDIMKVLTVFSAIFIPLTFLAGIYGTNFEYLPELGYGYSYFIFLGTIVVVASAMLLFFKRRRWQ